MSEEQGVSRVALSVNDLEKTTSFYRDIVGLDLLDGGDERSILGVDEPILNLIHEPHRGERGASEAGLYHTAFRFPDRAALGDALARADEWGLDGASDHGVSEALYFKDPEGNGVEVYRDKPEEEWLVREDGSIDMVNHPLDLESVRDEARGRDRAPAGTSLGHMNLEVTSLQESRSFYTEGFGLRTRSTWNSALFLAFGEYHHHVGLNTWHYRTEPKSGRGLEWFEFEMHDAIEIKNRLNDLGIGVEVEGDYFVVEDPDQFTVRWRMS